MRYVINFIFLFLLLVPSLSSATVCGTVFRLLISYSDVCGQPSDCGAYGTAPPNCTATFSEVDSARCLCAYQMCCDDTALSYEDGVSYNYSQQNIGTQNASDLSQEMYTTYAGSYTVPAAQPGYILTGSFEGYVYGVEYDMNGNAIMDFAAWKRGYYTKIGSAGGTIEPISGGGGTGGGTGGDVTIIGQSGPLDVNVVSGTGFGGLTVDETAQAVETGVSNVLGYPGVFSGGDGSGQAAFLPSSTYNPLGTVWTDFVDNVKTTSLYGLSQGFFSDVPSNISAPSLTILGGATYGTHTFEMSWFATLMSYLAPVVIVACAFVAVRVVVIKGGGV